MAVAVFDADVLIAYLGRQDSHHEDAVEREQRAHGNCASEKNWHQPNVKPDQVARLRTAQHIL